MRLVVVNYCWLANANRERRMNMKKVWMILIACCVLLGACAQRTVTEQSNAESSTSKIESVAKIDLLTQQLPIDGLATKTEEELLESYIHTVYYNDDMMSDALDTPLVLYFLRSDLRIPLAYDKRTGVFSPACRDTLCDHETCLWGNSGRFFYRGASGLFFLYTEEAETVIYETDFYGNGAKELYRTTEYDLSHLVEENGYLYVLAEGYDDSIDQSYTQIIRIDMQNGDQKILLRQKGVYYFMPLDGKILYLDGEVYSIADPETEESVRYADETFLPVASHGAYFYYYKDGALYCKDKDGTEALLLAETPLNELCFSRDHIWFSDIACNIYCTDLTFSETRTVCNTETKTRPDTVFGDGNLLFYTYSEGERESRKHYLVFYDLQSGAVIETER